MPKIFWNPFGIRFFSIKISFPSVLCVFASLLSSPPTSLSALEIPEYRVGETARVDVVSPMQISAIDPIQTEVLRERELPNVHIVYRFDTNVAERSLARLSESFQVHRIRFLAEVEKSSQLSRLGREEAEKLPFDQMATEYRKENPSFPLLQRLARVWILSESDASILNLWSNELARSARRHLRPANVSSLAKEGPRQARIVVIDSRVQNSSNALLAHPSYFFTKTNFTSVARETSELRSRLKSEWVGNFLGGLLEPNCFLDPELTSLARSNRLASIWSIRTYQPGEVVVRAGQVVDSRTKTVLDDLRSRLAERQVREQAAALSVLQSQPRYNHESTMLLMIGGLVLLLAIAVASRRLATSHPSSLAVVVPSEARAGLSAHLAHLLSNTLFQRLIGQRRTLLAAQSEASDQASLLEKQMDRLESGVQARLIAYQERIVELEKELAAAEEQNRDLIRAKISLAREELATEQQRNRIELN